MKHSPAPWHETDTNDGQWIVRMDKDHAVVIGDLEDTCGTCHGNAALIAAAPDLLDALKDLLRDTVDFANRVGHVPNALISIQKAYDAIAKAEGK